MASFESKVSDIFEENPKLSRNIPIVIRKIFNESESEFSRRVKNESENAVKSSPMRLFDILFIDYYFKELNNRFLNWVIEHNPSQFTKAELDEMRAQTESHLDFYEVQEVFPGEGSYVKSLFTGEEGFLRDISSSKGLVKWDIFLTRCYRFHGDYYATGSLSLFDQSEKNGILKRIENAFSGRNDISSGATYADFAKNHWEIFFQIEHDIQEQRKNKKFYTKYGELQLCEVRFQVNDFAALLEKVEDYDEFNFIETKSRRDKKRKRNIVRYQFDWLTLGIEDELEPLKTEHIENGIILRTSQLDIDGKEMGIDVIGNLYIDPFLFRLETRSLELAEFAVRYFTEIFGDMLTFKRIIKKKLNLNRKPKINEAADEPESSELVDPELRKNVLENYYLSLLDEKLPALNNLTPREAREDTAYLPLLIDWLKGLENMNERKRMNGEDSVSIEMLKKELDIDY